MARASDVTSKDAVLAAIRDCDAVGREAFLATSGFGPSRQFVVVHEGREYDSKALLGGAFRHQFPGLEPLRPGDFSGGDETRRVFERFGFSVVLMDGLSDALAGVDAADEGDPGESPESSASGIPSFERLMRVTLEAIPTDEEAELSSITTAVCDAVGLDDTARGLLLPNGRTVVDNRVRWVVTCLAKARLVDRPGPLMVAITNEGRRVLETHDGDIDRAFLIRTCPPFANWIADMGELPAAEAGAIGGQTVWMVRAGRQGVYAPAFVERSLVIVGWGSLVM